MLWGIILVVSAVSGVVQSVTGFGSAILIMMVMPHFFNMLQAPAITSSITLGITAGLAWHYRKQIDLRVMILPTVIYELGSVVTLLVAGNLDLDVIGTSFVLFLIFIFIYFEFLS